MGAPYAGNALTFLVQVAFGIYILVLMLRVLLEVLQADYYNPLSQFVVKLTEPVLAPLRRIVPRVGRVEGGALLVMLGAQMIEYWIVLGVGGAQRRLPVSQWFRWRSCSISAPPCSSGRSSSG